MKLSKFSALWAVCRKSVWGWAFLPAMGIAGAVQAQEVTSATVSPTTYNTAGETLTFTVVMNTGNEVVSSPSVTSSIGVTYSCSPVRGTTNTNITCSGIYTVQAGDISSGALVVEVATATNNGNTYLINGSNPTMTASYVAPVTNTAPTAAPNATPDPVEAGAVVTLDGTGSSDPDVDPLTYSWVQTGGPATSPSSSTAASFNITAPAWRTDGQNTYTYELTVNDGSLDSAPVTTSFTVQDTTDPTLANVPSNITVNTEAGQPDAAVTWPAPTATDNSGIASLVVSPASGSRFAIGQTVVTVTATDIAGNVSEQTFTVTVVDSEQPVFSTFPADITVHVDVADTSAVVNWTEPTVDDNSGSVTVSSTSSPTAGLGNGSSFPLGVTTVTYRAEDGTGNFVERDLRVEVLQRGQVIINVNTQMDGTFNVSSPEPELNTAIVTSGGSGSTGGLNIGVGGPYSIAFAVPASFALTNAACNDADSTIDPATLTGALNVDSGEVVTCTLTAVDSGGSTTALISEFQEVRGQLILQGAPKNTRRIGRLNRQKNSRGGVSMFGVSVSSRSLPVTIDIGEDSGSFSFSTRETSGGAGNLTIRPTELPKAVVSSSGTVTGHGDADSDDGGTTIGNEIMTQANGTQETVLLADMPKAYFATPESAAHVDGGNSLMSQSPWEFWIEGSYANIRSGDRDGSFTIVHTGVDYLFNRNLLMGLGMQYDDTSLNGVQDGISGKGFMFGPYMTARLKENLFFDARAAWGESDNRVSPFGTYTDSYDSERWLATAALVGDYQVGDIVFSPEARLSWYEETSDPYVDSLSVAIPSVVTSFGSFEITPTMSRTFGLANGGTFTSRVSTSAIWTFDVETGSTSKELTEGGRGRVEIGGDYSNGRNLRINSSVFADGIGESDFTSWGLSLGLDLAF
ncbi:HYR domain-containing protein [Roseovarius sp.]|uniref:HYR domain-containing protein n=1 Tax=Roseovarius sp. TaxID=1486281 RepID=UPI002635353E|nr:HYR domain-containing protein [Roseovarius sp.]